ncbi:SHOCT domain-containing protein [Natrinema longum]|uniref:SHOCT domain-containing protein n=1 Tax=Natrinema longum TaxID=370324 RepID=A0A8A2U7V9_9EURY|nr:SHOCT domain-containing protein [Natrinema longum]MBZ6493763.1 SHOCT domain-containing protein [Natrinema longum]QSW84899.1 SHOCT domain-containing protein [Natrinema longum]
MAIDVEEFVADDLWLLIGLVTFVLISLTGLVGAEELTSAIAIVGWFLLVPIFLFWGEEIAALLVAGRNETTPAEHATGDDAVAELKRRYAEGEIDDAEFEHRLERLVGVEDSFADVFSDDPKSDDEPNAGGVDGESEREPAFER